MKRNKKAPRSKAQRFVLSFLYILLGIFLIYSLWLSLNLSRFKTYKPSSQDVSLREVEGAYHMHSTFSDGRKNIEEIAALASSASLDFIILTDHGEPNFEALACQGWKKGVLVLSGSELSISRGHLVALDFKTPSHSFSQNAEESVYQIKALHGFTIIAHPYSKVSWSWGKFIDYSGIEIINADSMLKKDFIRSLPHMPALFIKPQYALLKILVRPEKNIKKWDALNKIHPIYGYFSVDAHLLYRPLFFLLRLHLPLKKPLSADFETAKRQIYDLLKHGNFYNAVDSAAQADGFRFWAEKGKKKIPMGGITSLDSVTTLYIKTPFPFAKEAFLIHNGNTIHHSREEMLSYKPTQPGIYRVEVYLKERTPLNKKVPWIVSNPIFLTEEKQ